MAKIHDGGSLEGKIPLERFDDVIFNAMRGQENRVCITNATHNRDYTCGQVIDISTRLAVGLERLGCKKGDVVTLYAVNSEEFVFVVLASLRAGLIVNTINPAATSYELRHYLKIVGPRVIYTETGSMLKNIESSSDVLKHSPKILLKERTNRYDDIYDVCAKPGDVARIRRDVMNVKDDVAFILFSSGTTGLPKGVMLTHHNMHSHVYMRKHVYTEQKLSEVAVFPMYHVAGVLGGLLSNIYIGSRFVFFEKFHFETYLKSIEKYQPSTTSVPPSVVVQMAKSPLVDKYDLSSIKIINTGAAPTKKETETAFKNRLNVKVLAQAYGMTESSGRVLWFNQADGKGQGSCGKVPAGVQLKITNPETGELLGPDTRGELLVKSSMVMKGYIGNPEATHTTLDRDGWLHTGDIAYYDEEGYFYIVDRMKELIKYKSNQVAPAELEALLLEHPGVADVGVIGVPDTEAGELPKAYITKAPGSDVTEQDLKDYVKKHASHYKQLRGGVAFIDEIPRLASGKVLRHKLKEMDKKRHNSKL